MTNDAMELLETQKRPMSHEYPFWLISHDHSVIYGKRQKLSQQTLLKEINGCSCNGHEISKKLLKQKI